MALCEVTNQTEMLWAQSRESYSDSRSGFSEAYVFACLLFSDFMYPWIYFLGPEQKTPKGNFFFLEGV